MSEQTARLVDRLRARLNRTLRRMTWADAAFGGAVVLGTLATAWLLATTVEAVAWLGSTPRTVVASVVALTALGVTAAFLARPLARLVGLAPMPSEEDVARRVGERYPEVSDRLVNLLQLVEGRRSHAPAPMIDHAVQRLGKEVEPVAFEHVEDFQRARRAVRLASLPVVGVLAFLLVAPSTFLGASQRLLAPQTPFDRPAPFRLTVDPGDTQLVRGDSLRIVVRATGDVPASIDVALQPTGESRPEIITVRAESTGATSGVFRHTVASLRESTRYRAASGRVTSDWYTADVIARPLVRGLQIRLSPPAYTGLPDRTLDPNVGDVTGLPGTEVRVSATLGGPDVVDAALVFDDGAETPLTVDGDAARGTFTLRREGTYRVRLTSADDVANRDPIRYRTSLRADARPSIAFLAPDPDAALGDDLAARLRLRLSDDYGFSRLRLHYRLSEQRYGDGQTDFQTMDVPLDAPSQLDQEVVFDWLLAQDSGLDLVPGDVVAYYATVWDNDAVAGYKSARTATQTLRMPSLAEKYEQAEQQQDDAENLLNDLKREAEDVGRQFDDLKEELRRKQDSGWEDQRQLEQIQQKQKALDEGVEQLSRQMEEMTRQMQEDDLISPETAEKYRELQRVIEEIDSPELREALQKLQQSMQDVNLRQMQQSLEDFEFNEEQYRERLQRSLDLFKQIKAQQKLEEIARRAAEMEETQKQLEEETTKRLENEEGEDEEMEDGEAESGEMGEQKSRENGETTDEEAGKEKSDSRMQESGESQSETSQSETQQSGEPQSNEALAEEQERAAEQMRDLMNQMQEMADEMQDVPASPTQQMQQLNQQMQQQNLPQQMQQNSQQLRQNQLQDAKQGQQQMQQQLQQMQQQLQGMQQSMQGQQQQMNVSGLRAALDNTLRLSRDQEDLRQTVAGMASDSPTLRRYAQNQQRLSSGLESVSDSLQTLARRIPQMSRTIQKQTGDALREMSDATESLSERNASRATGHQKGSMMHLNELALLLSDLLNQMQGGQGSGGGMSMQQMLQQLQQMSGQQQKLNQQIQQFLNDVQGNRLSTDQQKRLQQLARQQQQLKQQLDELGKGSGLRDDVLGDLDKIARQMEETIRELQEGRQSRRTIDRQRQILTRMLEAQRSLRTQGKDEKRQGRQSEDEFSRERPDELTPQEQADRLRRDLIRALESGYAPDYEELIKRYFELLQETGDASTN